MKNGFTLLEMLVVIVVLITLAAFASMSWVSSIVAAREAAAFAHMKTITAAEIIYQGQNQPIGYATLKELGDYGLIDSNLASGFKQGYQFSLVRSIAIPHDKYSVTAVPVSWPRGTVSYTVNESGDIKSFKRVPSVK